VTTPPVLLPNGIFQITVEVHYGLIIVVILVQPHTTGAGLSCGSRIQLPTEKGYKAKAKKRHEEVVANLLEAIQLLADQNLVMAGLRIGDTGDRLIQIDAHGDVEEAVGSLTVIGLLHDFMIDTDDRQEWEDGFAPFIIELDIVPLAIEKHDYGHICPGCYERSFPSEHSVDCPVFDMTVDFFNHKTKRYDIQYQLWQYTTNHGGIFTW